MTLHASRVRGLRVIQWEEGGGRGVRRMLVWWLDSCGTAKGQGAGRDEGDSVREGGGRG